MILNNLSKIVVWKKNDNSYYYRVYNHCFLHFDVGYHNSYGHEVILIIEDLEFYKDKKFSKKRLKRKMIDLINKI